MLIDFSGIVKPGTITKEESVGDLCNMPPQKSGERACRGNLTANYIISLYQRQMEFLVCDQLGRSNPTTNNDAGKRQVWLGLGASAYF